LELERLKNNLTEVLQRINAAKVAPNVQLVAVTKYLETETVKQLLALGQTHFGENRWQVAQPKVEALKDQSIVWHFIGRLQSNKAAVVVEHFDLIHSVESLSLAKAIDKEAKKRNKIQKILLQINASGETSKQGLIVKNDQDFLNFVSSLAEFESLEIQGLMTMAPLTEDQTLIRDSFKKTKSLFEKLDDLKQKNLNASILSMGMSDDFELALKEGATLVRIGRALIK
jgi:pyridoxal phosphate enzyme (YggS family)